MNIETAFEHVELELQAKMRKAEEATEAANQRYVSTAYRGAKLAVATILNEEVEALSMVLALARRAVADEAK